MASKILIVDDLVKTYSGKRVVDGLSFDVDAGEIVGILGPNGAGKTTAFYMTVGLIRPDSGTITFQGTDVTDLPVHRRARMGMGYLAQEPSIFRTMTVADNIRCILETLPLTKPERNQRHEELLEELNLAPLAAQRAGSLSGGERRRLEITRALITKPSFLLLDEPFANIDPIAIHDVKTLIRLLTKKNIGILITDHNAREIFSVVDRSYLVQSGRVTLSGTPAQLIDNPEARQHYLGTEFAL